MQKKQKIEIRMEDALANGEFKMYLQPQYSLLDESVSGVEALVRWQLPDGSLLPPNDFIPIFEDNGFIRKLDYEIFCQACQVIRHWLDTGISPVTVAVNFSRLHLNNKSFVSELCGIADKYCVPHELLEIELTESVIMNNMETLTTVEQQFHRAGMRLTIDDFGAGFSSLGVLKDFRFNTLKLDRSFFEESEDPVRAQVVIAMVIQMAHELSISTVAEGIEDRAQVELLKKLDCDVIQGYYYAKPMPPEEAQKLLKKAQASCGAS